MITEQQLKEQCTPEIIKKMVDLAEGFKLVHIKGWNEEQIIFYDNLLSCRLERIGGWCVFHLLIHRAVEGINSDGYCPYTIDFKLSYITCNSIGYRFKNYQPQFLTPCECACLHCLIEVLK